MIDDHGTIADVFIRYEGGDADSHQIDVMQLGESLQGFGRIYAVAASFAATGKYAKQVQALPVRAYATEPQAKCFQIPMALAWAGQTGLLQGTVGAIITAVVSYVIAKNSGQKEEMRHLRELLEKQMSDQHGNDAAVIGRLLDTIDKMADSLRPSAIKAAIPVGQSCSRIELPATGGGLLVIDAAVKEALSADPEDTLLDAMHYTVIITELDREKGTCKVRLAGEDEDAERISGVITDPAFAIAGDIYSRSFAAKSPLSVMAKATVRDGNIIKLHISDGKS